MKKRGDLQLGTKFKLNEISIKFVKRLKPDLDKHILQGIERICIKVDSVYVNF